MFFRNNLILKNNNYLRFYSSSNRFQSGKYKFRNLVHDLNLRWTLPTSIFISIGLWFYLQDKIDSNSNPTPLKLDKHLPPTIQLKPPQNSKISDPSTTLEFPSVLLPDNLPIEEPLRLIGLGVRTVSFLAIKVYVAGFYVDPRALRALRVIPGWNDNLSKDQFLSGSDSNPSSHQLDQIQGSETLISNLLKAPVHFAIRIAPVRPTDFTHLRDGFCRSLSTRIQLASKDGKITEPEFERASRSIDTFRSFFPSGVSVPKGKSLTIIRTSSQKLMVEYDGKKLGELDDSIVADQLFLAYFADKDPISQKLKESVAEGFSSLYPTTNSTSI